jgi:CHAD domain-containing protein
MRLLDFAGVQLARLRQRVEQEAARCAADPAADPVHDLRVAIRRFREALHRFEDVLGRKSREKADRRVKKILDLAGAVRDCDIAAELLEHSRRLERVAVLADLARERDHRAARLRRAAARWLERTAAGDWQERLVPRDGEETAAAAAAALLPGLCAKFFARGAAAARPGTSVEDLHRFRLSAKRFRYTLELYAPLYGRRADRHLKHMRKVQSHLGDINDCAATRVLLEDWRAPAALAAEIARLEARRITAFRRAWRAFASKETAAAWQADLARPSRRAPFPAPPNAPPA